MLSKATLKRMCPGHFKKTATSVFRKIRLFRHRVDMLIYPQEMQYFCPCCGLRIRGFVKADYLDDEHYNPERYKHARQDVLCPSCMSLPRHRILAAWFEGRKELLKKKKILYFAPEYSMMLWMKRNGVSFTTADLYNDADLKLDIQKTGLKAESYDVIICNHVLEHVDDFRLAINEMFRIIKYRGLFICSFPVDNNVDLVDEDPEVKTDEERYQRFGQSDHRRVFGRNAGSLLKEAGFQVERINGEGYPDKILPVIGPADYDMNILFCCVKRDEKPGCVSKYETSTCYAG